MTIIKGSIQQVYSGEIALDELDARLITAGLVSRNPGEVDPEAYPHLSEQPSSEDGKKFVIPQPPPLSCTGKVESAGNPKGQHGPVSEGAGSLSGGELDEKEIDELFGSVTRDIDLHLEGSLMAPKECTMKAAIQHGSVNSLVLSSVVLDSRYYNTAAFKSHVAPLTTPVKLQSPCGVSETTRHHSCQAGSIPQVDLLKELFSPPTYSAIAQRPATSIRPHSLSSMVFTPNRHVISSAVTPTSVKAPTGVSLSSTGATPTEPRGGETKSTMWSTPIQALSLVGPPFAGRPTPPLCKCGRRAKRQTVTTPGPNDGRHFFACPLGKACSSKGGCGFFMWVDCAFSPVVTSPELLSSEYDEA